MDTQARASISSLQEDCCSAAGQGTNTLVGGPTAKGHNGVFNDAVAIANALETQYGVGIFLNLEYQRHLTFIQIR